MLSLHDSLPICLPSTCARATQKPVSGGKIRAFLDYRSKPCPIRCWMTISRMRQAAMLISTRWRHERYDVHEKAKEEPPSGVDCRLSCYAVPPLRSFDRTNATDHRGRKIERATCEE